MGEGVFKREGRSLRPGFQDTVFDTGVEEVFGRLFGDSETLGLDQSTGVLRDAIQLILKRDVESSGHYYIIAAVSVGWFVELAVATFVLVWQEMGGCDLCATVLL
jgi:hypothetical protein